MMQKRFLVLGILGLVGGCSSEARWTLAEGQHPQAFHRRVSQLVEGRLLLFLPARFDASGRTRYPLLIFLHGSGEAGEDLEKIKAHGPPQFVDSQPDFPFIVASPQSPQGEVRGFDPLMLEALLQELLARLPVDPDRVYLTGLSLGGIWSYAWASLHPEHFAAIAPVSATGEPADACKLKGIPVWAFHGAKDDVVPLAGDQALHDAIHTCGGNAKLTVYPDWGHDAWTPAYSDPALYQWLMSQRRVPGTR